jgi:hypothetical protein
MQNGKGKDDRTRDYLLMRSNYHGEKKKAKVKFTSDILSS